VEELTRLPSGEAKHRAVREMFDRIAPRYDRLNRILSLRLDQRWRREALRALDLRPGDVFLDLACGTGDFLALAQARGARLVGADFSREMLRHARQRGVRAPLVEADAARLPLTDASVTALACGFALRNFVKLDEVIAEAARVIAPGGRMALLEVDEPANPLLRAGHAFYFQRVVPWLGAWLSDRAAYRYLPQSVQYLPPEADLLALIARGGFRHVAKRGLSGGIVQLLTAEREGKT
jgi:demethylmenaquinone methyltransferase/2-methoxy-6-polyprenyl-1,4-benzoquinol methylase